MVGRRQIGLVVVFVTFVNASAHAAAVAPPPPPSKTVRGNAPDTPRETPKELDSENLFSRKWRGFREILLEHGIEIAPVYKGEYNRTLSGGRETKGGYLGNFDLKLTLNAEKFMGWKGGTVFLYGLWNHGKAPNSFTGTLQGTSNIEVETPAAKLYEAWIQQSLWQERASILLGLHDLNSEFYVTETSTLFLNPSFGIGADLAQTGLNGPSIFPVASLAARVRLEPTSNTYFQVAAFDAVPGEIGHPKGTRVKWNAEEGILWIAEAAYLGREPSEKEGDEPKVASKFGIGAWQYSKEFDRLNAVDENGDPLRAKSTGAYALADHSFGERFSAFLRYGVATHTVNQLSSNLALGGAIIGVFPGREEDRLGIALTRVTNGSEYMNAVETAGGDAHDTETIYELTYRAEIGRGWAIQPTLQQVIHPGTEPALKDAWVGSLRFDVSF